MQDQENPPEAEGEEGDGAAAVLTISADSGPDRA